MKRFLALLIVLIITISIPQFVFCVSNEFVENKGFEDGTIKGHYLEGPEAKLVVDSAYAKNGRYGVGVLKRQGQYSTIGVNVKDVVYNNGAGQYKASVWLKLKEPTNERVKAQLVINYGLVGEKVKYITSRVQSLTNEWQEFVIETEFKFSVYDLEKMTLYPQVQSTDPEVNLDFCVDDISFKKTSEIIKPDPNYIPTDVVKNATTDQLLYNSDFELGDEDGFRIEGPYNEFYFEKEYARTGEYGLLVDARDGQYSTMRYDLVDTMWEYGSGKYRACFWLRLTDPNASANCQIVFRINVRNQATKYLTGNSKAVTSKWQKFVAEVDINFPVEDIVSVALYPQVRGENNPSFCVDDVTLYKTSAVEKPDASLRVEDIEVEDVTVNNIDVSSVERPVNQTTVGAIRWDAWYGHDNIAGSVISQVEKTLSPAEFHFRAPFFAEVTEQGGITIPEYTQEIFDQEMEYAIEAGIDYFAYCWYGDALGTALKLHQTSKYKNDVKLCLIIQSSDGPEIHNDVAKLLKEDYYMTVLGGRPLMYYFSSDELAKDQIKYYRGLCKQLGLPEPYAVMLNSKVGEVINAVGDAIGNYAIGNDNANITYQQLAEKAMSKWTGFKRSKLQFVPTVTTGYHLLPRYKNPVTWMSGSDKVAEYATAAEIEAHLFNVLEQMQVEENAKYTKANTVLIYAWNEHDEGGWICPTIKVDANGKQMYGENGEKLIDTSRIQAVKNAINAYKQKYATATPIPPEVFDGTATSNPEITPNTDNGIYDGNQNNSWIYIVCGTVALVVAATVVVIIIAKKKKNNKKEENNEQQQ